MELATSDYPESILNSVYWRERGSKHVKIVDCNDDDAVARAVNEAATHILEADALLFVTGAGAGVDMGLPDFRSSNKFWEELGHPDISKYEDASDNKWFDLDPGLAWGLNYHQLAMYRTAEVHEGYAALLQIAQMKGGNYFCYTSNIDGVLQRSGFDENKVREVHGNIHRLQCTQGYNCKDSHGEVTNPWQANIVLEYDGDTFRAEAPFPRCPNCGALARPNVWFCTDSKYVLWKQSGVIGNAYCEWLDSLEGKKVVVLEFGAGLAIPSARVEAEETVTRFRGVLIRVNPVDHMVPVQDGENDCGFEGKAISIPMGMSNAMKEIKKRISECENGEHKL